MIEKLKRPVKIGGTTFREKINELVDAVNELQLSIKPILEERESGIKVYEEAQDMYDNAILDALKDKQVDVVVEPADPYAEQRKCIGCLCKFRDTYEAKWHFGILEEIYQHSDFPFGDSENFEWAICEPVKPDDDIIFKGE